MDKKEQIKLEIAQKKAELENLEREEINDEKNKVIKSLSEFTIDEKIQNFDALYTLAESIMEEKTNDDEHYAWEAVITLLARDKSLFWKYYNKLNK